jgi:hypothetical protein
MAVGHPERAGSHQRSCKSVNAAGPGPDERKTHATSLLDPKNGLAPGDPARMAARIIESVDHEPAPLRMVLGSQALEGTLATLRARIATLEAQTELAASTDFPPGE